MFAGGELVRDDAEREDVGPRVHGVAAQLFGRHVAGRADRGAGQRQRAAVRRRRQTPRDSEVHDLDPAVGIEEHVLWLEVAVDDAVAVRGVERFGELQQDLEHAGCRRRA
jgi:hypothetical protein